MKPRKVMLTLEVETDAPLAVLRKSGSYSSMEVGLDAYDVAVLQVQANVVEPWDKKPSGLGKE